MCRYAGLIACLKVAVAIPILLLLGSSPWLPVAGEQLIEPSKATGEPPREHPALPISVALVEARDVVDDAQSAHSGAHGFEGATADAVSVRDGLEDWQELVWRPFELYEDCEEDALVRLVSREQYLGQFIEPFHAGDSAVVEVDFGAGCHFEGGLFL